MEIILLKNTLILRQEHLSCLAENINLTMQEGLIINGLETSDWPSSVTRKGEEMGKLIMIILLALVCLDCGLGEDAEAGAILSDSQFNSGDWSSSILFANNVSSYSVGQEANGGNLTSYRNMVYTMPGSHSTTNTYLWIFHQYLGDSYNPSADGAISSVDYSEDQIEFEPPFFGSEVGTYSALVQDGVVYVGPGSAFSNTTWQTASQTGLTFTDYIDFNSYTWHGGDGVFENPDFSLNGSAINFGYIRANSTPPGTGSITTKHGIDNWSVAVNVNPVPEPATMLLFGTGLAGLVGAGIRKKKK